MIRITENGLLSIIKSFFINLTLWIISHESWFKSYELTQHRKKWFFSKIKKKSILTQSKSPSKKNVKWKQFAKSQSTVIRNQLLRSSKFNKQKKKIKTARKIQIHTSHIIPFTLLLISNYGVWASELLNKKLYPSPHHSRVTVCKPARSIHSPITKLFNF